MWGYAIKDDTDIILGTSQFKTVWERLEYLNWFTSLTKHEVDILYTEEENK